MSAAQYLFTRCRDALPHKKGDQAHGRTPRLVRLAAIIAGAKAFTGKKVDWSKAVAFFKSIGKGVPARHVASHRLAYLKQRWRNFIKWGNIDDAPRSGRPPNAAAVCVNVLAAQQRSRPGQIGARRVEGNSATVTAAQAQGPGPSAA